jgi:hypothetical protein
VRDSGINEYDDDIDTVLVDVGDFEGSHHEPPRNILSKSTLCETRRGQGRTVPVVFAFVGFGSLMAHELRRRLWVLAFAHTREVFGTNCTLQTPTARPRALGLPTLSAGFLVAGSKPLLFGNRADCSSFGTKSFFLLDILLTGVNCAPLGIKLGEPEDERTQTGRFEINLGGQLWLNFRSSLFI